MPAPHRIPRPLVALPKPPAPAADVERNDPGVKPALRERAVHLVTGEPDPETAAGWARAARASMLAAAGYPAPRRHRSGWLGLAVWFAIVAGLCALAMVTDARKAERGPQIQALELRP